MAKKNRTFTLEQRYAILQKIEKAKQGGMTIHEAEAKYGIAKNQFFIWRKKYGMGSPKVVTYSSKPSLPKRRNAKKVQKNNTQVIAFVGDPAAVLETVRGFYAEQSS